MTDAPSDSTRHAVNPRILITAGPTHEPIDGVRYLANRSSGRMGLSIAKAACQLQCPTTLLLGPTALPPPQNSLLRVKRFQTTADLQALLQDHWPDHDALFMAAAVADYRPAQPATSSKLKRTADPLTIVLEPTPDLLAELSSIKLPTQTAIGFALESNDQLHASAKDKLLTKQLDAIVANPLETMDAERVSATVMFATGEVVSAPENLAKDEFGNWLLQRVLPLIRSRLKVGSSA